jgi:signal peptidase I
VTDPQTEVDTVTSDHPPAGRSVSWFRRQPFRWIVEWMVVLLLAFVAALVMRTFVFQTFYIPSGSMEPTLQIGDRIIVSKLSVEMGTIHTGDILVFKRPPAEDCGGSEVNDLVKRVIGLPGQALYNSGNKIFVDGRRLRQDWTHTEPIGTVDITNKMGNVATRQAPYVVPPNSYYMMGDNESDSCDSRYWGPISRNLVVGKVILRIWPLSRLGFL